MGCFALTFPCFPAALPEFPENFPQKEGPHFFGSPFPALLTLQFPLLSFLDSSNKDSCSFASSWLSSLIVLFILFIFSVALLVFLFFFSRVLFFSRDSYFPITTLAFPLVLLDPG